VNTKSPAVRLGALLHLLDFDHANIAEMPGRGFVQPAWQLIAFTRIGHAQQFQDGIVQVAPVGLLQFVRQYQRPGRQLPRAFLAFDVWLDVLLQHLITHARLPRLAKQLLLVKVERNVPQPSSRGTCAAQISQVRRVADPRDDALVDKVLEPDRANIVACDDASGIKVNLKHITFRDLAAGGGVAGTRNPKSCHLRPQVDESPIVMK
jgi:hypothetical protein